MSQPLPYLAFALICERALIESDGTLSLIRVVDKAQFSEPPPGIEGRAFHFARLTLAVGLRSGEFRGEAGLVITPRTPDNQLAEPLRAAVTLAGGESAQNVLFELHMGIEKTGTYWFDVAVNGNLLTRVPLLVVSSPTSQIQDLAQAQ